MNVEDVANHVVGVGDVGVVDEDVVALTQVAVLFILRQHLCPTYLK